MLLLCCVRGGGAGGGAVPSAYLVVRRPLRRICGGVDTVDDDGLSLRRRHSLTKINFPGPLGQTFRVRLVTPHKVDVLFHRESKVCRNFGAAVVSRGPGHLFSSSPRAPEVTFIIVATTATGRDVQPVGAHPQG